MARTNIYEPEPDFDQWTPTFPTSAYQGSTTSGQGSAGAQASATSNLPITVAQNVTAENAAQPTQLNYSFSQPTQPNPLIFGATQAAITSQPTGQPKIKTQVDPVVILFGIGAILYALQLRS